MNKENSQTERSQNDITKNTVNSSEQKGWRDIDDKKDTEIWEPIPGFEDRYLISSHGKIKSLYWNKILKIRISNTGYALTELWRNQKVELRGGLHRFVAQSFVPNRENKPQVNHKDGNKLNNHYLNLEWVTDIENKSHAVSMGLTARGERNRGAKLSLSDVKAIRDEFLTGKTSVNMLCDKYKIGELAVRRILTNKKWFDIEYVPFLLTAKNILKRWECFNKKYYKKFNEKQIHYVLQEKSKSTPLMKIAKTLNTTRQTIARIIKNEYNRTL